MTVLACISIGRVWVGPMVLGAICSLLWLTPAVAALPAETPTVSFRMAKYTFQASSGTNQKQATVEWAYPVILDGKAASTNRLNSWLRRISLATFFMGDEARLSQALKLSDRKVIEAFSSDAGGTADMDQSVLSLDVALGEIRIFTLYTESIGVARGHHGITVYAYDLRAGRPLSVESFFKPGVGETLKDLFLEEIQKESPACANIDFSWDQVKVHGPAAASISFPYLTQSKECGDGGYLKGQTVKDLLRSPTVLMPERKLREVQ